MGFLQFQVGVQYQWHTWRGSSLEFHLLREDFSIRSIENKSGLEVQVSDLDVVC